LAFYGDFLKSWDAAEHTQVLPTPPYQPVPIETDFMAYSNGSRAMTMSLHQNDLSKWQFYNCDKSDLAQLLTHLPSVVKRVVAIISATLRKSFSDS